MEARLDSYKDLKLKLDGMAPLVTPVAAKRQSPLTMHRRILVWRCRARRRASGQPHIGREFVNDGPRRTPAQPR